MAIDNKVLVIRNPNATRPWQHVLEPLIGYLLLAEKLCSKNGDKYSGPWNFGSSSLQNMKVKHLAQIIKKKLNSSAKILIKKNFVLKMKHLQVME